MRGIVPSNLPPRQPLILFTTATLLVVLCGAVTALAPRSRPAQQPAHQGRVDVLPVERSPAAR